MLYAILLNEKLFLSLCLFSLFKFLYYNKLFGLVKNFHLKNCPCINYLLLLHPIFEILLKKIFTFQAIKICKSKYSF